MGWLVLLPRFGLNLVVGITDYKNTIGDKDV